MEKLNLIVTTDGTISAENSVSFASRILSDYFAMFQISDDEPILEITEDIDEESLRIR